MIPDDRERALELLQQAYAEGRLDPGELERRIERALTAVSAAELEPIIADLPAPEEEEARLTSTAGPIVRTGDWLVPRRLQITSEYGKVRLDLSRAHIPYPRVDIDLRLTYGSATIILPAGGGANVDGVHTVWGRATSKAPGRPQPGAPYVRVTGELTYGSLTVRNARR
jgi:hypothetical protein